MGDLVRDLTAQVQHNCDISDARFAREYTLCTYLLKMREFFRWERGYRLSDRLPNDEVGPWLEARERRWEGLEEAPFAPIRLDGLTLDPFDSPAINRRLTPRGLVYSAGIGAFGKPHFFLARLERHERRRDYELLEAGVEFARDLTAPPAMYQAPTIFVRRQSVRRMIWEKLEEWQWRRGDTPMGALVRSYGFEQDPEGALDAMAAAEAGSILLHEEGEQAAGALLGGHWEAMLADIGGSKAEYLARAVRDHLADSLTTLPRLIGDRRENALHFYAANLTGLRRDTFPALLAAYRAMHEQTDWQPFEALLGGSRSHWEAAARRLLELWQREPATAAAHIEAALPALRL